MKLAFSAILENFIVLCRGIIHLWNFSKQLNNFSSLFPASTSFHLPLLLSSKQERKSTKLQNLTDAYVAEHQLVSTSLYFLVVNKKGKAPNYKILRMLMWQRQERYDMLWLIYGFTYKLNYEFWYCLNASLQ